MDLVESYRDDLRFARKPITWVLLGVLLAALLALPWYAHSSWVVRLTVIALYAIGVMGQNILIGYTGQISFGQAGFLAIGAYTFGHLKLLGMVWNSNAVSHDEDPSDEDCEKLMENLEEIIRNNFTLDGTVNWTFPDTVTYHQARLDEQTHLRAGEMALKVRMFY